VQDRELCWFRVRLIAALFGQDGKCLSVSAGAGSAVNVASCTGKPNQHFVLKPTGSAGAYTVAQGGLCVDNNAPAPPPAPPPAPSTRTTTPATSTRSSAQQDRHERHCVPRYAFA
jgi:hypothetical protein